MLYFKHEHRKYIFFERRSKTHIRVSVVSDILYKTWFIKKIFRINFANF